MPFFYEYDEYPRVRSIISIVSCFLVGIMLLVAGTGKLAQFGTLPGQTEFLDVLIPDVLFTPEIARFIGFVFIPWILPVFEIVIGLMLIIGIWPRLVAIVFLPLVFTFMASNAYAIASGREKFPDCECFGIWANITPMVSMYLDIAMLILALFIIVLHPGPFLAHHVWVDRLFKRNRI